MFNWGSTPMSRFNRTTRQMVRFRMVRPLIDLLLLLAAMYAFIQLNHLDFEQKIKQKTNLRIQSKPAPTKALYVEEKFDTEANLWLSWSEWIQTNQPGSGQCLIETKANSIEQPFYLLCFGNHTSGDHATLPKNYNGPEQNLLIVRQVSNTPKVKKTPPITAAPEHKIQGWMITGEGQKTFDPAQGKWLP